MLEKGALDGIKVLDISRLLPGPFCSMILADHGADVIAIEDGTKGPVPLFFDGVNRNKRHVSLNLKQDEGKEIFYALAKKADVILEGFRPGVVKRLGVDYDTIKAMNPGIIYCSITGYGQTGPLKEYVGHDVNYLSHAGVLDLIGPSGAPPSIPGIQVADIAGGSMNAAMGILLALYAREKSGKGQYIDISMTDGVAGFLFLPHHFAKLSGQPQRRSMGMLSHRYACYNTYQTKDGKYVAIGAVEHLFWKRLCELLGQPDYAPLQYDEAKRHEIIDWLRRVFLTRSAEDWNQKLSSADVCFTVVHTLEEVMESDLFKEREMVAHIPREDESIHTTFGIATKLSETPGTLRSAPVPFGASTQEVLKELGYSEEKIESFKKNNIV